jgi:integrase
MGVYRRPDSPYWWLYLETAPPGAQRVKTTVVVGETAAQRRDSRTLAQAVYFERMNTKGAQLHKLPIDREAIRFAKYAAPYQTNVIAHRKGARREEELLRHLVTFFGADLLTSIDSDRVREYQTARLRARPAASATTINREVDLLKVMLRDAVPKYLPASPIVGLARLKIIKPRRRYTSVEEFDRLLKACEDPQDRAILLFGRDGLARLGDLLDLKHTDRDGLVYHIADPKGGEPYEMALSPRAAAAADALANNESRYLFPKFRRAENPRDWPGSVRQRLEYLCRQAGLPYGRTANGITFHWGTRRSGATDYVVKQGQPLASVQQLGGWKTPDVMIGIYNEVSRADLLALVGQPVRKPKARRRRSA